MNNNIVFLNGYLKALKDVATYIDEVNLQGLDIRVLVSKMLNMELETKLNIDEILTDIEKCS